MTTPADNAAPEFQPCRTTRHCADHGWCRRCDPEFADVMARVNKAVQDTDPESRHWGRLYEAIAAELRQEPAVVARQVPGTPTTDTAPAEAERQAEIADSVTAHTKALLARRTETLRKRAEAAEAERDQLRAERAELIRQRDQIAMDTIKALPATADRATVLHEAADYAQQVAKAMATADEDWASRAGWACASVATGLRRLADEAQPTETARCTCADAGPEFAPAGHYADCPHAATAATEEPQP